MFIHLIKRLKRIIISVIEYPAFGYRLSLFARHGTFKPKGRPNAPWANAVLKKQEEVVASTAQVRSLGLPLVPEHTKNWDTLAALDLILKTTGTNANIFDAGGARYSMILPWLFLYGYKNLIAENLDFQEPRHRGPIIYRHGDITKTDFHDNCIDAITCLSVIEHGVDLKAYFNEMSRILKPGGILITSADYYETPIDTLGQTAYGCPIHIFNKNEIIQALEIAKRCGLELISPLDLSSDEKVAYWKRFNLYFTFVIFSLRKVH
jgi:hypothetical protein